MDHEDLVSTYIGQSDKIGDAKANQIAQQKARSRITSESSKKKRWWRSKLDNAVEAFIKAGGQRSRKQQEVKDIKSKQSGEVEKSGTSEEEESLLSETAYPSNDKDADVFE